MKITKEHVLEALEVEQLGWGAWFCAMDDFMEPPTTAIQSAGCQVCAVGACLLGRVHIDNISKKALRITRGVGVIPTEEELPINWMGAISLVWESLRPDLWVDSLEYFSYTDEDISDARECMIEWVEDNVPEDINLVTEVG